MKYGYSKKVDLSFEETIEKTKAELQKEQFGVLTEIDVKSTLKNKLNVDFENYIILGACNPPNAYKTLQAEIEIGLLLPCNVIVYQKNSDTFVSAILPTVAMSFVENKDLENTAQIIEEKLKKVIDNI
ncbi:MAG: DUF302 domain-containing protein [Candidatus Magasanikbacteria bacterium]|nr:DUF302 domain-containing protein [Candidatus Magasanikbacteria bacterium]